MKSLENNIPNALDRVMAGSFPRKFAPLVDEALTVGIVPEITAIWDRQTQCFGSNRPGDSHSRGRQSGEQLFE
jgi:hypothetical protein